MVTLGFIIAIALVVAHHQKTLKAPQKPKADLSKFLQVKEWDVYLELPDTESKVSYKISASDPNDITLSSAALDQLVAAHPECANANTSTKITRVKTTPPPSDNKQIGAYYYFDGARPSVSPCIGTNIDQTQTLSNQAYDLWDKLPSYKNVVLNP